MREMTALTVLTALCLAGCGGERAAEEELDPAKRVIPDKSSRADPALEEDLEKLTWVNEVAGEGNAGTEKDLSIATSLDDPEATARWVVFDLTPEQARALETQREENRKTGGYEVTIEFTEEQLEAIRKVCPESEETSITWDSECIYGGEVALPFDDDGRIITPEPPRVSR